MHICDSSHAVIMKPTMWVFYGLCEYRQGAHGWLIVRGLTVWRRQWEQWFSPLELFALLLMTLSVFRSVANTTKFCCSETVWPYILLLSFMWFLLRMEVWCRRMLMAAVRLVSNKGMACLAFRGFFLLTGAAWGSGSAGFNGCWFCLCLKCPLLPWRKSNTYCIPLTGLSPFLSLMLCVSTSLSVSSFGYFLFFIHDFCLKPSLNKVINSVRR